MRVFSRNRRLCLVFYNFLLKKYLIFTMGRRQNCSTFVLLFLLELLILRTNELQELQYSDGKNNTHCVREGITHTQEWSKEDKSLFPWSWLWVVFCTMLWVFVEFYFIILFIFKTGKWECLRADLNKCVEKALCWEVLWISSVCKMSVWVDVRWLKGGMSWILYKDKHTPNSITFMRIVHRQYE